MSGARFLLVLLGGFSCSTTAHAGSTDTPGSFSLAIDTVQRRAVKLHGGSFGREVGYGSGVITSADGCIVTVMSVLLESPSLRVVLPDGRRFPARIVRRDEARQLALLKIDANDLPHFDCGLSDNLQAGDWLVIAANPFKVADGPEPLSIATGVLAGRGELSARRRAQDFAYGGPVLFLDAVVATPGSAGGAVVDVDGRLVGIVGKAVISTRTNTWTNYALPTEEVRAFLRGGAGGDVPDPDSRRTELAIVNQVDLGIRLFDVGGRTRPAYVERVLPGSPAFAAGVRPDDLVLSLNDRAVATCEDFYRAGESSPADAELKIIVKRGDQLFTLIIDAGELE